jgi:hypothetical protein
LIARFPRLGAVTIETNLSFEKANSVRFPFVYGTLVLNNLPLELGLAEGADTVVAGGQNRPAAIYEPPGPHTYRFTPADRFKPEQVTTNIVQGANYLIPPELKGFVSGAAKIPFAWIDWEGGGSWPGKPKKGFWVGIYEITQDQYKQIMGDNPSVFQTKDTGNYPVENVTWDQARSFCDALSAKDANNPTKPAGWRYTLPTEEQFNNYSAGATDAGVIMTTSATKRSHPESVGSTGKPSTLGLYDVVGNVSEWVDSAEKFAKGASFKNFTPQSRLQSMKGTAVSPAFGFRVVLVPGQ